MNNLSTKIFLLIMLVERWVLMKDILKQGKNLEYKDVVFTRLAIFIAMSSSVIYGQSSDPNEIT